MKPILYNHDETSFTNNGLGRLADCISCLVTEERNGIYECQFTYPVTGEMYSKIQIGCILGVIHDDSKDVQPFDIYAKDAPMNGVVTFYAHHVSYRLGHIILQPVSYSSITAAFAGIPNKTYNGCPFTFWTDKSVSATWTVEVPSAVKAVLGGVEGSILDVYGKGEYEWDKFAVKLHLNRGNDNGVSIRYGVNLSDLDQSFDVSETYNAVAPYWKSEDGTLVTLPEGYIAASSVQTGEEIIPVPLDLRSEFEDQPTVSQLRAEAQRQLDNSEAWIPNENISVKFIDLAHTQEYKEIAALQRVRLCDKVSVYCGPLGVNVVKMQIIKTVYNVLLEEYDEIELGTAKTSFADTLMAKVSDVTGDLPTSTEVKSMLRQAVDEATDQITGAQNSHVRFIYDANGSLQEIVILDTDDIAIATKVWRWNSGGLGYSSNGYAGPYTLAMTQNGAIVADFITTGTLTAALIRAGVLQDVNGYNFWNLETGEFSLSAATTVGGSTVDSIAQNKANNAISTFDNNLNQQSVFNRLTNNGQTQGIYLSNGKVYINASYIQSGVIDGDTILAKLLNIVNENNEVIASFDDTIVLGRSNKARALLNYNSFSLVSQNGDKFFAAGDMRDENGLYTVTFTYHTGNSNGFYLPFDAKQILSVKVNGNPVTDYYYSQYEFGNLVYHIYFEGSYINQDISVTFKTDMPMIHLDVGTRASGAIIAPYSTILGKELVAEGTYSHAEGYGCKARSWCCHAEGYNTEASGGYGSYLMFPSHAEGSETIASGRSSHAEGNETKATGDYSHAEGYSTQANGNISHAEGDGSITTYESSHAEGYYTQANAYAAHAEGSRTQANGSSSHAEGSDTIANCIDQHVFGRYNIPGTYNNPPLAEDSIEIVGNGSNYRSNARTLSWSGNEWIAGTLTQASDSRLKEESGEVPDLSTIRARRFKWNDKKGTHDDLDHIGYFAQDVEKVAPYLVQEDAMGYKSLDYIALLCAKVEYLERRIKELENKVKSCDD